MNIKIVDKSVFEDNVKRLIINLRRKKNIQENWFQFRTLIENDINFTCSALNTRMLVSVSDTYADYGNPIERRNALYISMLANFEKLSATRLLIYDLAINSKNVEFLKRNRIVELWDGMHSFNLNHGDMINNMFYRLRVMLNDTPVLAEIFECVLKRIIENNTVFGDLSKYHKNLVANPKKKSILKKCFKKIRIFFRDYRLL